MRTTITETWFELGRFPVYQTVGQGPRRDSSETLRYKVLPEGSNLILNLFLVLSDSRALSRHFLDATSATDAVEFIL